MVRVSGPIRVVTDRPLLVSQVRVRAARDRAERGGLTTALSDSVPVRDGQLDMVVLPGPAVLVLEVTGGFSHAVKLVVPDVAEATLEQCVTAAEAAGDADRRVLERLAGEVARDVAAVAEAARSAGDSASAAAGSARDAGGQADRAAAEADRSGAEAKKSETSSDDSRAYTAVAAAAADRALEAMQGVPGGQGDTSPAGTTTWAGITGKPEVFTPAVHSHEVGDVTGLVARFGGGDWVETPTATGDYSVALGNAASAGGKWSAALGNYASAAGRAGFALGPSAEAGGDFSLALGNAASSAGDRSTAIGNLASATGGFANALTARSKATKDSHTVIGIDATDENIPTDVEGTVVVGKAGVPVYLAGRDVLAELDAVARQPNIVVVDSAPAEPDPSVVYYVAGES